MDKLIKIIIADDNRFFCEALKDSLDQHEEFSLGPYFTTLEDLISYTNSNTLDILVLDVNFNGNNSLDYISQIKKENSSFKIIALTTLNNNYIKGQALENGVDCFVGKDSDLSKFKSVIIDCYAQNKQPGYLASGKVIINNLSFTKRKLEILQALYKHSEQNDAQLSEVLSISLSSLKTHKRELFEITNTTNIKELLKFGIQNGLIIS